jgi:replicative DNA helicase
MPVRHDLTHRLNIERIILGECLLERGFPKVVDILKPANFSTPNAELHLLHNHQDIFQAFMKLYPHRPIDIVTVSSLLPKEYWHYLCELTVGVVSTMPLRNHALMLIEISLRESFLNLLRKLQAGPKDLTRLALYEVMDEALDYSNDIFEVIDHATVQMAQFNDAAINTAFEKFTEGIDDRMLSIARMASIDVLLDNLHALNYAHDDTNAKMALTHLSGMIKSILSEKTISHEKLDHILNLTT